MKKHCVYVHRRKDTNTPFYIGCCTIQENTRCRGVKKYRRAFDFRQRMPGWFKIRDEAGGVNVEIAFVFDDKEEAFKKEYDLVELYGRKCFNNGLLSNECRGGVGAPGQINSIETRRKKSEQQMGSKNSMYGKKGKGPARKIENIETGKTYISVSDAAEKCGYKMKTLYNWLSGHRKNPTDLRFV